MKIVMSSIQNTTSRYMKNWYTYSTFLFILASCNRCKLLHILPIIILLNSCSNNSKNELRVEHFISTWADCKFDICEEFCQSKFIDANLYCNGSGVFKYATDYFGDLSKDFEKGYELKIEKYYFDKNGDGTIKKIIAAHLFQESGQSIEVLFEELDNKITLTGVVFHYGCFPANY